MNMFHNNCVTKNTVVVNTANMPLNDAPHYSVRMHHQFLDITQGAFVPPNNSLLSHLPL